MLKYLQKEIHVPQGFMNDSLAPSCGRRCKIYIKMTIDTTGYVRDSKVLKGCKDCPGCDAEVLRAVSSMPRWEPGRQNGRKVNTYYTLPVSIHLR